MFNLPEASFPLTGNPGVVGGKLCANKALAGLETGTVDELGDTDLLAALELDRVQPQKGATATGDEPLVLSAKKRTGNSDRSREGRVAAVLSR